jgi:hypothetical protein
MRRFNPEFFMVNTDDFLSTAQMVKVKLSRYRRGEALGVPGS